MSALTRLAVAVLALAVLGGCTPSQSEVSESTSAPIATPKASAEPTPVASSEPMPASEPAPRHEPVVRHDPPPPVATPPVAPAVSKVAVTESAPSPAAPTPAKPPPLDPLQRMRDEQQALAERQVAQDKAKERMIAAQANIEAIEKRLLPVRNPFLPRPELPPEEAKAWQGLDGAERVKRIEDQLAAARLELEAARKAYLDLGGRLN